MPDRITLNGITWNHTRGYLPMVATGQRWSELHPEVEIVWHKRSLQAFADFPIERLVDQFDLLVVDHPFVGTAAAHRVVLPLDQHLPASFFDEQARGSVGYSHASYRFDDHQWALAIDAATPVSSYRPDLINRYELDLPQTWDDLLALARHGRVTVPAIPIDSLMNFYMLCVALGSEPCAAPERVVDPDIGIQALEQLRELVRLCDPRCLESNPIASYELMTTTDDIAYCPFAYGYSNYARPGYAPNILRFGGLVSLAGHPLRSTLGGTGLAISPQSQHIEHAVAYAEFMADPATQCNLYFTSGGQPGHRTAWTNAVVNDASNNFFKDTLATLDQAYVRPRYHGYLHFQDHAGAVVHQYLVDGENPRGVIDTLDMIYRRSRAA